ncbi:putative HTH-type transcriptional regulator [compost metagenome]
MRHTRLIGRQALVDNLVTQLPRQRFITLVGPGGIGKTTVALRVAEQLIGRYRDGIRLLDLAPINDPLMISGHLATLLGLSLHDSEPMSGLALFLRERQLLLVIDNCEHLIDSVALLCENLLRGAPHVHILATSRESLRAEGEFVQRLESLDCPPPIAVLDRAQALSFSALQLFVERAMASHDNFELHDAQLPLVIDICRRLDGIPLALELAAAQVASLGLDGLLAQLHDSFRLLTHSSQTTLARHQTLHATLDWSFELLNACEQTCLRRLGVFRGGFTLASAAAVIVGEHIEPEEVFGSITQLVAKSLLSVDVGDEDVFYRLLDTTRSYALEKLEQTTELPGTRERHAQRCLTLMQQAQEDWELIPTALWIERYARGLEDIRAALDWGLNARGPQALAIQLTAASTPLWQELSLLREHGGYVRKALALLDAAAEPCPRLKMSLKLALGSACYHAQGGSAETIGAFVTARTLAKECNDVVGELRAVSGHMAVNLSCGHYQMALEQSQQFDRLGLHGDPVLSLSTHRLRVLALHFAGDQQRARLNAEEVIQRMAHSGHINRFTHGFGVQYDQSVAALTILARILWLRGQPEQAWRTARQALDVALQINHGTSICYTLALAGCLIAHYNGNTRTARELLQLLLEQAQKHSVQLFYNWAQHYAQVIDRAAAPRHPGVGLIKEIMVTLDTAFVDDDLLQRADSGAAGWSTAEILRARADALLAADCPVKNCVAETVLIKAINVAKSQGALAWELRSATSLARLWQRQGRYRQAHTLLAPIYQRFTEGHATPDLKAVRRLLDELQSDVPV